MQYQHDEIFSKVFPALQTKMGEFQYYGYHAIQVRDLWQFCVEKKWRKKRIEELRLYEIVSTILSVSPSEIVSYGQIHEIKATDWFANINKDELQVLLNPKLVNAVNEVNEVKIY